MPKTYVQSSEDNANFSDCLLKSLTQPPSLVMCLREKRGKISRDICIRSVIIYTLCSTVLGRIGHVPCPRKQARALRHLQTMFVGGILKKRRAASKYTPKKDSGSKTRDRACAYIERLIIDYLADDFEKAFRIELEGRTILQEMQEGDLLLEEVIGTLDDSPSLRNILPTSILSFVFVLMDLMKTERVTCVADVSEKYVEEFRCFHLSRAFESITSAVLKHVHPSCGAMVGGDGRPRFPPSSAYGRDGEVVKLALSNATLASALSMGAHMRKDESLRRDRKPLEMDAEFRVDTCFPLLMHAVLSKKDDQREYDTIMEDVEDFLIAAPKESLVNMRYASVFLKSYDTLQKCNRISLQQFRGPGVVLRSKHIPDAVLCRQVEKRNEKCTIQGELLKNLDANVREFRRTRDCFLDTEREVVHDNGSRSTYPLCPISKELCYFLYNCVRLAEKLFKNHLDVDDQDVVKDQPDEDGVFGDSEGQKTVADTMVLLFRQLSLGLFSSDLSGNVTTLYEDYIYSALKRHFDEREGVVASLKAASKRRNVVRRVRARNISGRDKSVCEDEDDIGAVLTPADEDWGPSRVGSPRA